MDRIRLVSRRTLLRLGSPVAFLLAVTVGILLVRAALHHRGSSSPATSAALTTAPTLPIIRAPETTAAPAGTHYRIASGDTFSSVAIKFGTTVEELQALNPGVDPHGLTVGQRIRVR